MSVRARQVLDTRTSILDAAARVLARGVTELTIPAVAEESGASVRTVYRHFPSKKALVEAVGDHYYRQLLGIPDDDPESPEDLVRVTRQLFTRVEKLPSGWRAAASSRTANDKRREFAQERCDKIGKALEEVTRNLAGRDREHFVRLATALVSTASLTMFETVTGAGGADAAETVAWTLAVLGSWASQQAADEER